ncbi:uncharacterized protein LOC126372770 [Pectinophora gossypiella]|uniref:uncharacterized protein LOC126366627 n=1 Tax=Pectinophora gossypiella TaxID=13191 RepID=UPI00214E3DB1|nr:uncharacterized protein LOC126366627 [Pectinophora gossypiella]XP_049865770.1 uncharacterized protein LOC126366627 [Pectinophora gossypiella]XP_049865944.1 uncharacterized protein LOC126366749 [Pectinophora gossypiella]XP_049865945.1 uncharacterized protein LOC126366749 [Pectinophora gossypiella]XP_049874604.1 uncharacterized protein LOC126372770 [Pectinophora gossypiella]XP_049874605.1 uncharacterized protein LOC126372770 [Pectinophora gossypiella]
MPKRKRAKSPDLDCIYKKIKLLEKQVREHRSTSKRRHRVIESSSSSSSRESSPERVQEIQGELSSSDDQTEMINNDLRNILDAAWVGCNPPDREVPTAAALPDTATGTAGAALICEQPPAAPHEETTSATQAEPLDLMDCLDSATMEILGEDPTAKIEYGPSIHKEIANRLEHFAVSGIDRELRKELNKKYLTPDNCVRTGAPMLNDEIRAALPESVIKRDKILQAKQQQLATIISCLSSTITEQINQKEKNHDLLQKLMDMGRLLCDVQHAESIARRNFAIYSVKKEMKDHLAHTSIDKYLFGENLSEALKAAKAVNKSGSDLKIPTKTPKKNQPQASKPQTSKNWKQPAQSRRQQTQQRSRETTSQRGQHTASSKRSPPPSKTTRRR